VSDKQSAKHCPLGLRDYSFKGVTAHQKKGGEKDFRNRGGNQVPVNRRKAKAQGCKNEGGKSKPSSQTKWGGRLVPLEWGRLDAFGKKLKRPKHFWNKGAQSVVQS